MTIFNPSNVFGLLAYAVILYVIHVGTAHAELKKNEFIDQIVKTWTEQNKKEGFKLVSENPKTARNVQADMEDMSIYSEGDKAKFFQNVAEFIADARKSVDTQTAQSPDDPLLNKAEKAKRLNKQLIQLYKQGKYDEAAKIGERLLTMMEKSFGKNHLEIASFLLHLGGLNLHASRFSQTELFLKRALSIRESALGQESQEVASVHFELGRMYDLKEDYVSAEVHYKKALDTFENDQDPDQRNTAILNRNLARLYSIIKKLKLADIYSKRALNLSKTVFGNDHIETAKAIQERALYFQYSDRPNLAAPLFDQAYEINIKSLGAKHPETARALQNSATAYFRAKQYDIAYPKFKEALALMWVIYGKHPFTAHIAFGYGLLCSSMGKNAEAEKHFKTNIGILEELYDEKDIRISDALDALAQLYFLIDDGPKRIMALKRSFEIKKAALGPNHDRTINTAVTLAHAYLKQEDYFKAEPLLMNAIAIIEKQKPINYWMANYILNAFNILAMQGSHSDDGSAATKIYKRALGMCTRLNYDLKLNSCVGILRGYSEQLAKLGKLENAEKLLIQALSISEKIYGKNSHQTAYILLGLGSVYKKMNKLKYATASFIRSIENLKDDENNNLSPLILAHTGLALIYNDQQEYSKELLAYQRALKLQNLYVGEANAYTLTIMNGIAWAYNKLENYPKAQKWHSETLGIRTQILGKDHPDTIQSMINLADVLKIEGHAKEAERLLIEALKKKEKLLGSNHIEVALLTETLTILYSHDLGDPVKALPLAEKTLQIRKAAYGEQHPDTIQSMGVYAILLMQIGDTQKATEEYDKIVSLHKNGEYDNSFNLLMMLATIIDKRTSQQDLQEFDPILQKQVQAAKKRRNSSHQLKFLWQTLGLLHFRLNRYEKSLKYFENSLRMSKGATHIDISNSHSMIANNYMNLGKYAKAEKQIKDAIRIREKLLLKRDQTNASYYHLLAVSRGFQGDSYGALDYFKRMVDIEKYLIDYIFSATSERQKYEYIRNFTGGYFDCLSLIANKLASDNTAMIFGTNLILARKGIILETQARIRSHAMSSKDPRVAQQWEQLNYLKAKLSKLLFQKRMDLSAEETRDQIEEYQSKIESLEKSLALTNDEISSDLRIDAPTLGAVAARLPKDALLIEIIKIKDQNWDGNFQMPDKLPETYFAFIINSRGHVEVVKIGDAKELEGKTKKFLGILRRPPSNKTQIRAQGDAVAELFNLLWKPLSHLIADASKVIVSPDGIYNIVPLGALRSSDGSYLVEKHVISYVSASRDLLRKKVTSSSHVDLFLAANPAYDQFQHVTNSEFRKSQPVITRSSEFREHFFPLPGTLHEAEIIPRLLSGKVQTIVTGKAATESRVLSSKRPKVLHLATHGFFMKDDNHSADSDTALHLTGISSMGRYENPLVRSGIAFAGANMAKESQSNLDGILTALEVTSMDLDGTDLVTLSACETGVGEIKTGEGVFGLRRAFALAGAKNMLMSLWPVSDQITATQMERFYTLYGKGKNPPEALREAQLETIADLRKKYGFAAPSLWAPFIMQGSPRMN